MLPFETVDFGEGVAEGVTVYTGGGSSIDSQWRCVGSGGSEGTEESPAKNHLFGTVSVVVEVETEVYVEKTVVATGSGVTEAASFKTTFSSFKTMFSLAISPISEWRDDT